MAHEYDFVQIERQIKQALINFCGDNQAIYRSDQTTSQVTGSESVQRLAMTIPMYQNRIVVKVAVFANRLTTEIVYNEKKKYLSPMAYSWLNLQSWVNRLYEQIYIILSEEEN